jgi:hypothetical protein
VEGTLLRLAQDLEQRFGGRPVPNLTRALERAARS